MLASYHNSSAIEAGLDEAGRGCLAGPVVAAAAILPKDFAHDRLNDSKQVSEKMRDELRIIIEERAIAWAVAFAWPREIDRINILKASFLAMHRAVEQLKTKPECLLVDGNRFSPYLGIPHVCFVKGDGRFLSIAAASILAKTHRDEYMKTLARQFPQYGWEENKGYPTAAHREAIRRFGLTEHHRVSFKLKVEGGVSRKTEN